MPVRMTREGRAETREAKRTEQNNQQSKSGKAAGFSSTSQKGNIVHGKLKSQKELKKITGSEDYKKSDYEGKTKMLNVATANKGMSVKQKKLAAKAPPPNKLDEKDFAVLRAEKAKGRGMGLQDEKVQPGKVMKAKRGVFSSGKISDMSFDEKMKRVESGQINKKTGKFTSMNAMRDAKGFQKGESASEFNKRRMKLAGAQKVLSASRIGKIVLPIAAAGVAAQQYLKSKMNKKKDVKKKMGGGMMKPMGYTKGGGADTGTLGERKSKLGVALQKVRRDMKKYGKDTDRLTQRDIEYAKRVAKFNKMNVGGMPKKMGGGMMKKPMGYKDGTKPGAGPLGAAGIPSKQQTPRPSAGRPASQQQNKRKGPDLIVMMPVKEGPAKQNTTIKTVKIKNRMGGGMMQKPMGYRTGTMVKARGCKLGRTRPTKIT
jgi:hypothetical protein